MSIKSLITARIDKIRAQIAVWENPKASLEAKGAAIAEIVGNDPAFWSQIARVAGRVKKTVAIKILPETQLTATPIAPAPEPVVEPVLSHPPAPVRPADAPPRKLTSPEQKTPEQRRDTWHRWLAQFVSGECRIDAEKTRSLTKSIIKSGVKLDMTHWKTLFDAMLKAYSERFYLIDSRLGKAEFFSSAPPNLLRDFAFGKNGLLPSTNAEISECNGAMPSWLCAKSYLVFSVIKAADMQSPLDKKERRLVEAFIDGIEQNNGPDNLLGKCREVYGPTQRQNFKSDAVGGNSLSNQLRTAFADLEEKSAVN